MSGISEMTKRSLSNMQATLQKAQEGGALHNLDVQAVVVVSNIRGVIDETDPEFLEFAESVRARGVQQPVLVRPAKSGGGKFELIAGERRLRASRLVGRRTIPAIVKHVPDKDVLDLQVIENVQRLNLTMLQEAAALQQYFAEEKSLEKTVLRWQQATKKTKGINKAWVSERLQLLDLAPAARALIEESVTADVATINSVNRAARIDPVAGESLAKKVRIADKKRDVARRGLEEVKAKAGKGKAAKKAGSVPIDWGREAARLAGALASAMQPTQAKPELERQVRATLGDSDKRAAGALQGALKEAHGAGMKLAKGWQTGLGASLAVLAAQLDTTVAGSAAGRALVLKAFALGAMKQPYDFETIVVS